jgi:hypothetical protein
MTEVFTLVWRFTHQEELLQVLSNVPGQSGYLIASSEGTVSQVLLSSFSITFQSAGALKGDSKVANAAVGILRDVGAITSVSGRQNPLKRVTGE